MWTKTARAVVAVSLVASGAVAVIATAPDANAATPLGVYHPVTPTRILDTRNGVGAPKAPVGVNKSVNLVVTGNLSNAGTIPANATAVVLNVTVDNPTASGYLTVYGRGTAKPTASSLNWVKGQTVPNLVIAPVGSGGAVTLQSTSAGLLQLLADISGYYAPGATNGQGTYVPVAPARKLDTRVGTGAHKAAVAAGQTVTFAVTGGSVPAGPSAVALNITVTSPAAGGYITAWNPDDAQPTASTLNFAAGETVPNLAIVPVSADGTVELRNGSGGTVQLIADVQGYFVGGDPVSSGAFGALAPHRVLDTRFGIGQQVGHTGAIQPGQSVTFSVLPQSGVPISGVAAVVVNLTVTSPSAGGFITAYSGPNKPVVSNLNFVKNQTVANLAVIGPLSTDTVTLFNDSTGTVDLLADVAGYTLSSSLPLPATSSARYVRNINGTAADTNTMAVEGCADHASSLVVLDIGAQLNNETGVELSNDAGSLSYDALAADLTVYLAHYASCGGHGTVAIATNNEGDFTTYTATERGADWATKVMNQFSIPDGVTVLGADDIESNFASTEAQAEQWITAYLANAPTHNFLYIGSATGCPTTYGVTGATCANGWTQANYYAMTRGLNPSRISAMPQIYTQELAVQWGDIAMTGGTSAGIVGALTENKACPTVSSPGCNDLASLTPSRGWAALYHAVSTVLTNPTLASVADLQIDSTPGV